MIILGIFHVALRYTILFSNWLNTKKYNLNCVKLERDYQMNFMNNCDVISLTREVIPYFILIMKSLPSKKNVEDGEKLLKMRMKKACVCSPNILFSCTCWLSHHHRHSSMWVCDVIWASELFKFLSHCQDINMKRLFLKIGYIDVTMFDGL